MASEKAKALAAKQKAQLKAEKQRRKQSNDPKDWGQVKQVVEAYKATARINPKTNLYLGLSAWVVSASRSSASSEDLPVGLGAAAIMMADHGDAGSDHARRRRPSPSTGGSPDRPRSPCRT